MRTFLVSGSIRLANFEGCGLLAFRPDSTDGLYVGEEVHVSDLDGCEAWGPVTAVEEGLVTFRPVLGSSP